jgi:TetR/AcrR family transcriptional regulator, regulator of autoinduction and epiphytic fitness
VDIVAGDEVVATTDGRSLRRVRSYEAVVEAILDLLVEGKVRPTAKAVAERSGVSLRTVFRLFDDVETLNAAALARQSERVAPLLVDPPATGSVDDRIAALVAQRSSYFEAITGTRRHALRLAPTSPTIARGLAQNRRFLRRQVGRLFAPEVAAAGEGTDELLDALAVAAGWETWEALRAGHELSADAAGQVMARLLRGVLHDMPIDPGPTTRSRA